MQDSKRDTDVKNRLLDYMGEGEGGMICEKSIETCVLSYMKQIASPGLMHKTGCSGLVHWHIPEGWMGREVGGGSGCGIHVNVWQKPLQYCKVISLQVK